MTMALKVGLLPSAKALASPMAEAVSGLKGAIVAACYNPIKTGKFSRETHETALSRLNLTSGKTEIIPLELIGAHDVLKVKDNYLVLPNAFGGRIFACDFTGGNQKIDLTDSHVISGHGYYDEKQNVVLVSSFNKDKNDRGEIAVLDPDNFKLLDLITVDS